MRLHDPLGVWWGVGGPPLDVVAAVLLDTLGVATDAPFYPLPDETVEEVARRWLLESHGTEWYDPMHEIPISTE
jgi:hypothetical protein